MTDVDYRPAPAAKLAEVAVDEVAAFRLINGEPRSADIQHLIARVRALIEPTNDAEIEAAIVAAMTQGRK